MLGAILVSVFFVTLPWVWMNALNVGFNVRPSILGALPLILYFLWKGGFRFETKYIKYLAVLLAIFIIWYLPTVYNQFSHWKAPKLLSLAAYLFVAYFAARGYVFVTTQKNWKHYWPLAGLSLLAATTVSFYIAFGTLVPNTNVSSSTEFIHNTLYGSVFKDEEGDGGKGIRHTMALIPVMLLAFIVHNQKYYPKINVVIGLMSLYLVLYTFSRSAWLAAFLIVVLITRQLSLILGKQFVKIFFGGVFVVIGFIVLAFMYPDNFSWVLNILGDRITDDRSTSGRLWVLGHILTDTTVSEYIAGYNREFQTKPHNLMFDALMQSGLIGMFGAAIIVFYVARLYFRGLKTPTFEYVAIAAFVAPAFVRMFTAGSGMLHLVELFGICVAVNLWRAKPLEGKSSNLDDKPMESLEANEGLGNESSRRYSSVKLRD